MRRKRHSRKNNNKRFLSLMGLFVMITITLGIIYIPRITSKADTSNETEDISDRVIKILEVEPSNDFRLDTKVLQDPSKVEITKIDMPRFISMIDEIDGKYDIVYIGNKYSNSLKNNWFLDQPYRRYNNSESLEWGNLDGRDKDINGNYTPEAWHQQIIWYGIGGYVPGGKRVDQEWDTAGEYYSALYGNNACTFEGRVYKDDNDYHKYVEYYSENDITNKRAKEIIKLLDSEQLVYMDSSILSDYKDTKLYTNFNEYKNNNKLNMVSNSEVSGLLVNMVKRYNELSNKLKRPIIKFDADGTPVDNNRSLNFKFYLEGNTEAKYKAKLLIDLDGDGKFDDKSKYTNFNNEILNVNSENELTYNLGIKIVGYVNWKLVIYDSNDGYNDIKTYSTGNIVFNNKDEKINIRVLQIYTEGINETTKRDNCNFNMKDNATFKSLLNADEMKGYTISVTPITIDKFNNNCDINTLVSNYDMIVLGFGDGYGSTGVRKDGSKVNNQFGDNAINALLEWNNLKKSIMFSHDSLGLGILDRTRTSKKNEWWIDIQNLNAFSLARNFKDIVGQCRYKQDPFINFSKGMDNNEPIPDKYDDITKTGKATDDIRTLGVTAYANMRLYDKTRTEEVNLINDSQISDYPFNLDEGKAEKDKGTIKVSSTHCQWYQINLEDEDIVPDYNLSKSNIDSGDSRNFYYTYTKGNITYTGSGDSIITSEEEMKLFINTMIKAYTANNATPTVKNINKATGNEIKEDSTVDIDLGQVAKGTPFIFNSNITDDSSQDDIIKVNEIENSNVKKYKEYAYNGTLDGIYTDDFIVDYDTLKANIGKTISIKVTATDSEKATGSASFEIRVVNTKLNVIHGINKDEENIIKNYSKYQSDWYDNNLALIGEDERSSDSSISLSGTRGYQCIIPFISKIDTSVVNNTYIELKLDKNYSANSNDPLDYAEAYHEDRDNSICYKPIIYIDYKGKLVMLKELERNSTDGSYEASITINDLQSVYKSLGVNSTIGDDCTMVLKYYDKTYNHNTSGDNDNILKYTNNLLIKQGDRVSSSDVIVNVGYKKLSGNLF